jgi:hypothetical protein
VIYGSVSFIALSCHEDIGLLVVFGELSDTK